jgi:primosomal protein N' (replication factor Y) (superfamily II helicase)
VSAELATDDFRSTIGVRLELEELGADQHLGRTVRRRAVRGEGSDCRLDQSVDDPACEDVPGSDELSRPARPGREVELLGRALLDDGAVAHERDPVCEREGLLAVVGDEDDGDAERADDLRHLGAQRLAQERVDIRPGLVEEHELRGRGECARHGDALLLTSGQLVRESPAQAVESDDRKELGYATGASTAGETEAHVLGDREVREEGVVLEDHPDAALLWRYPGACPGDGSTGDLNRASVGTLEASHEPEKRGLTAAGGAEERDDLAAVDAERGSVDSNDLAKTLRHVLESDHRALHVRGTLHRLDACGRRSLPAGQGVFGPSRPGGLRWPPMTLAEIYPLVTARALARRFTYEVPDDVGRGAVVSVGLGGRRVRGIVVDVGVAAPEGVEISAAGPVVDRVPAPLVELALWLADYYGSTPARTLALVAPHARARRGERRAPALREALQGEPEPEKLTPAQREAVGHVVAALDAGGGHVLLHGPTGSGKTEVYLQACAAALERGKGAIVLVPEIALTPQAVGRFVARFGDRVALLHSALTEAERRDERERIARGDARIVVGARSAIFAPVPGLGFVVVDEEHDASYKQESDPRYDARTVAAKRAALEGAVALYGSATPRAESWARLDRVGLPARIGAPLPSVRLVDLRHEAGYPLSAPLLAELAAVAERGGRAILLLNRRGVSGAIHCRACGVSRRCRSCDVTLTLHSDGRLHCHHCGFSEELPERCPECGSVELARIGAGTQRLEAELARRVPGLERVRLDADTATKPGALRAALERFASAPAAVLIGTQMVAKGHHFPGVAVAAVVDADTGLAFPDFRAEERTFQLVTQLAGRSGRDAPGKVLVQTFQPDVIPLAFAARHDVAGFLAQELARREELGYPPFRHLVSVVVSGPDGNGPRRVLAELRKALDVPAATQLMGPAPLLRLRGRHRAQLLAKTASPRAFASRAAALLAAASPAMRRDGLAAVVDVDPQSL